MTADFTEAVQHHRTGFDRLIGLDIREANARLVRAELVITPSHLQIHGVVHGGVYTTLVETLGSIGAALAAKSFNRTVVGIENHTSFLKAVSQGTLIATSEPLTVGRRTQIWNTRICDDQGRLVATGQLRLLCIEEGTLPNTTPGQAGSPFDPNGGLHAGSTDR
jgi:1,4-dihydroxy-2-naphthoyl-CoA hydrolase